MVLMISICYSSERARQYFWLYHVFGWLVPIFAAVIIYLKYASDKTKDKPIVGAGSFGTTAIATLIFVLVLCIVITSSNLLRFARRAYRLRHDAQEIRRLSFTTSEIQPLINSEIEIDRSDRIIPEASISN
jgi:hypothetical protein